MLLSLALLLLVFLNLISGLHLPLATAAPGTLGEKAKWQWINVQYKGDRAHPKHHGTSNVLLKGLTGKKGP